MNVVKAVLMNFSLYTRLPVPQFEWDEKSRRLIFVFFPVVGFAEALLFYGLYLLLSHTACSGLFTGALLFLFTICYTGGIHYDGFMDVCDALYSYRSIEEKHRIMKDPHTGAFAVIWLVTCMLTVFSCFSQIQTVQVAQAASAVFVISRSLCCFSIGYLRHYPGAGMLNDFSKDLNRGLLGIMMCIFLVGSVICACCSIGIMFMPVCAVMSVWFVFCAFLVQNKLGGINGDSCGWLITTLEMTGFAALITVTHM